VMQGKLDEARSTYESALRIYREAEGDNHPRVPWVRHCITSILKAQGAWTTTGGATTATNPRKTGKTGRKKEGRGNKKGAIGKA
jgi:hypothetical protein